MGASQEIVLIAPSLTEPARALCEWLAVAEPRRHRDRTHLRFDCHAGLHARAEP